MFSKVNGLREKESKKSAVAYVLPSAVQGVLGRGAESGAGIGARSELSQHSGLNPDSRLVWA